MEPSADQLRLGYIFFPLAFEARAKLIQRNGRFVHYTRAEAALNIIRSKSVWLRKAQWMNDYREVQHGLDCLLQAYAETEQGKKFQAVLNDAFPEITSRIEKSFNPWIENYLRNTFVACLSEHDDHEDVTGRLSMWRAYGGDTGVAIVVKSTPFTVLSDELGAYSSPVAYLDQDGVSAQLGQIAGLIEQNLGFVKAQHSASIEAMIHEAFRYGMIATKHPGFAEEREWRVVYSPDRDQKEVKVLQKRFETLGGVTQPVYSVPLKNLETFKGIEIPDLVDRIIVGPTRFPSAFHASFVDALENAGVTDAYKKVIMSDIPLRT